MDLVPADTEQVRVEQQAIYQTKLLEWNRQSELLKSFREEEYPAFSKWVAQEFSNLLKTSADLTSELQELETLIQKVENYALCNGIAEREAYGALELARATNQEAELWDAIRQRHANDEVDEKSEAAEQRVEIVPPFAPPTRHLKSIYRQLVRLLHPDRNISATENDRKIWQEVQDAYLAEDLQRLEALLATVTLGHARSADLAKIPIGDLIEMRREIEARLRSLKVEVRKAKANPAWRFRTLLKDKWRLLLMKTQITNELEADLTVMENSRARCEKKVESWRRKNRALSI